MSYYKSSNDIVLHLNKDADSVTTFNETDNSFH